MGCLRMNVKLATTFEIFKKRLKTELFAMINLTTLGLMCLSVGSIKLFCICSIMPFMLKQINTVIIIKKYIKKKYL